MRCLRRYPCRVVKLIGYLMVAMAFMTGCLAWAEGLPATVRPGRIVGESPVADAVNQVGSNTAWIGIAGIATIVVNGLVTAAIAMSKNKYDTAAKIAESEARTAAKVAEAKSEVREEMAAKEELARKHRREAREEAGIIVDHLSRRVDANSDAIASIPRRSSDASASKTRRATDAISGQPTPR
jgi:hypothetical protein